MDSATVNKACQEGEYNFYYAQGNILSLTMTKKPQIIKDIISKQATYIWVFGDGPLTQQAQEQLQKKAEVKISFVKLVKEVKQKFQNYQIILVCQINFMKQVESVLERMIQEGKIKCLVFYGKNKKSESEIKNCPFINTIRYVQSRYQAAELIKEDKYIHSKGEYFNFVSLENEVFNSNILAETIVAMINQNTCSKLIIKDFLQLAHTFYPGYSLDIDNFCKLYEQKGFLNQRQAVEWYTKESFVYRLLNRILRLSKDPTCLFIIQPYFKDLFWAVNNIYAKQQNESSYDYYGQKRNYKDVICYRGGEISDWQINFFRGRQHQLVQNLGFLSTSRQLNEAQFFIKNALFQIEVKDQLRKPELDYGYAQISFYSKDHQSEQQILFNPLNSFKIISFEQCMKNKKFFYKIKLKYGEMARLTACQHSHLNQKQLIYKYIGQHQIDETLNINGFDSVVINPTFNLEGCEEFEKKIIQLLKSNKGQQFIFYSHQILGEIANKKGQYEIAENQLRKCSQIVKNVFLADRRMDLFDKYLQLKNKVAQIKVNKGQFQKALRLLEKSQQIVKSIYGQKNIFYFNTLNCIGICYLQMNEFEKALKYLKQCQKINNILQGQDNKKYQSVLNLGVCYLYMKQHEEALKYFKQCQKIIKILKGQNHPDYAFLLNNLGCCNLNLYQNKTLDKSHFQKALGYFRQSQQIMKKLQLQKHPDYASVLNGLGSCYLINNEYQRAINYFTRSLKAIKILGKDHQKYNLILTYIEICRLNCKQQNNDSEFNKRNMLEEAENKFEQSLQIQKGKQQDIEQLNKDQQYEIYNESKKLCQNLKNLSIQNELMWVNSKNL